MPELQTHRYLVGYNYGQGGLWAFVNAKSPAEIQTTFEDLEVFTNPPAWLSPEILNSLQTYDIDKPTGWLAMCLRNR